MKWLVEVFLLVCMCVHQTCGGFCMTLRSSVTARYLSNSLQTSVIVGRWLGSLSQQVSINSNLNKNNICVKFVNIHTVVEGIVWGEVACDLFQ